MITKNFITQQYQPTYTREHVESWTRLCFVFIDGSGATFFEEPDDIDT
jgi:hypothetical protein